VRSKLLGGLALVAALAIPASALGGGYSTIELSSTPDGLRAGDAWEVEIRVLAHGRTPIENLNPAPRVKITETDSGVSHAVAARPAERAGAYRAQVVFPRPGEWTYSIRNAYDGGRTYPAVDIGRRATGREPAADRAGWALPAALVAGLAAALLASRRRPLATSSGTPRNAS